MKTDMKTVKDYVTIEDKGCITFSRICVNLGKVLNVETSVEEYYCIRDFPEDCSEYGCPHYMDMDNPEEWRLRELSRKQVEKLVS